MAFNILSIENKVNCSPRASAVNKEFGSQPSSLLIASELGEMDTIEQLLSDG